MQLQAKKQWNFLVVLSLSVFLTFIISPKTTQAQVTAFKQSVAEAASSDRDLAAFYSANKYKPIWTGRNNRQKARRNALMESLQNASLHGLPAARYELNNIVNMMKSAKSPRDRGRVEVALSKAFLKYAQDIQTGVLIPSRVDGDIKRVVERPNAQAYLSTLQKSTPKAYFDALHPKTNEYARLLKEKMRLERAMAQGGWGAPVPAKSLKPGDSGNSVVILRNRLMAMGYLKRSSTQSYDANIQAAVQNFQTAHGLETDGVAGPTTIANVNTPIAERLKSIIVALERERWNHRNRGKRHILVNLTDFSARILDNDRVTFQTRAVVGKNDADRRSPEFSDVMEYMVINPTWHVPRSIAVKEYLPMMKRNRNAAGHLKLFNRNGREVSRANINFGAYSEKTFPFAIKQLPSNKNALGLVKFMFPNKYNIYLHDTPAKDLFSLEKRDFSHGCIRLHQPFDFAYHLLAKQEADPKGFFQSKLGTGRETRVTLKEDVPVHIIYRTAFTTPKGKVQFRGDVYGRDARIWDALSQAGITLGAAKG